MTSTTGIRYNVGTTEITGSSGLNSNDISRAKISKTNSFNIPRYIAIDGNYYYPLSHEFKQGEVWYLSRRKPMIEIDAIGFEHSYGETLKSTTSRVTPRKNKKPDYSFDYKLKQFNLSQVIGITASEYSQQLIDKGHLVIPPHLTENWCWRPLKILRPSNNNQKMAMHHIVLATEACYSQIEMLTTVSHHFADETQCPISIEVSATLFPTTCLANRIRYQLWEPESNTFLIEYVDARTTTQADPLDTDVTYTNLMTMHKTNTTAKNQ